MAATANVVERNRRQNQRFGSDRERDVDGPADFDAEHVGRATPATVTGMCSMMID